MKHISVIALLVVASALALSQAKDNNKREKQSRDEIERTLLKMENEWAQVDVTNDRSVFQRIIAPDFVSTSRSGKFLGSRQEWVDDWEYEGVKTATNSDMKVHIYADNVAVVTGIDTTTGTDKEGKAWAHQDRFTDTWVKRSGVWQCVAAHVTRIK
jgi:ketosteroid isomerase-like protein